jgi:hypothetical protein
MSFAPCLSTCIPAFPHSLSSHTFALVHNSCRLLIDLLRLFFVRFALLLHLIPIGVTCCHIMLEMSSPFSQFSMIRNNPSRTLPPPLTSNMHKSIIERRRQANITLTKSTQWSFPANADDPAYISPPMSDSPTSPKRFQFPEERTTAPGEPTSGASLPESTAPPSTMTSFQTYPAPTPILPQHFPFGPVRVLSSGAIQPFNPGVQQAQFRHQEMQPQGQVLRTYSGQPILGTAVVGPVSIPTQQVPRIPRVTPRRGKAHVAKACQNCKKAHLSCDDARPCSRCVATRKEVGLLKYLSSIANVGR